MCSVLAMVGALGVKNKQQYYSQLRLGYLFLS